MNNYDLSSIEESKSDGISPYITYGTGQVLKINKIELKKSQNTGSYKAILHMETKPIEDEKFAPVDGAKGRVGKVAAMVYMSTEALKREFFQKMKSIATAIGVGSEVNKIKADEFEEVVQKLEALVKGKYARYTILASEYPKDGGKIGITLNLPKFKFVENEHADPSTIVAFNKDDPYHYKKIPVGGKEKSEYGGGYSAPAKSDWATFAPETKDEGNDGLPF